mgnify:FL=1
MYLPEYAFEMNEGLYQQMYINQAIEEYVPSTWGVYKQSASYAFHDSSFIHAADWISTLDDRESNLKTLTEEEWKEKGYDQSRTKYREGITENQAQILQQVEEREKFYSRYMKNTSMLSVGGITGMITGSLLDPINYIPFVGWAGRISKVARIASKMPILGMSANAMLGQTAFETVKQSHLKSLGRDVHWAGAMIDVGIAGLLGAGFGGIGKLSGLRKKINAIDPAIHNENMTVALTAHSDRVGVDSMQGIIDPNPVTTLSPSKELVVNDPVFRQEQIKRHQTTMDKHTAELDVDPVVDASVREKAIRSYNACKGIG